jgi:hypothetical protein
MTAQEQTSKSKDRDITVPLLVSGIVMCLVCAGLWLAAIRSQDYLRTTVGPAIGLVTPTPPGCPPVPPGWARVYSDGFWTNSGGWPAGEYEDDYADTELRVGDGSLTWSARVHQDYFQNFNPGRIPPQKDIYLVTSVRRLGGAAGEDYGLFVRDFGARLYYFAIDDFRHVGLFRFDGSREQPWQVLYFEPSALIRPRESNALVAFIQDTHLTFCINDQLAVELEDDNPYLRIGRYGVAASMLAGGDLNRFEFDSMAAYAPTR